MKRYDNYKPTGIEWVAEIPEHWQVKKLKYLVTCNDEVIEESTNEDYVINYVEISDVDFTKGITNSTQYNFKNAPSRARRKVQNGDIIVSTVRTYLKAISKVNNPPENLIVSTGFAVLRPVSISSTYLGYLCSAENFIEEIIKRSSGVSYPAINSSELIEIPVPVPSSEEQDAITKYLDKKTFQIDKLITNKQKLIQLLKEERTALINEAVTKGINPNVKLKPSGIDWLGDIPEHWEVKKLKYLVKGRLEYGANEAAELEDKSNPRYIRITDFGDDGKLRNETFKSLLPEVAANYLLNKGDILFARSGATVGKTFQFKNYDGIACYAGYLIKASPNPLINTDFLYYFTKSGSYENWKNSIFNQATIQNIGADKYSFLPIPVPCIEEQKEIVCYIEKETSKIDYTISRIEREIELLLEYRSALISEVVTGKVKIIAEM